MIHHNHEPIHMLWIGEQLPLMQRLCIKSWLPYHQVILWLYDPLDVPTGVETRDANAIITRDRLSRLQENESNHALQAFSDYFRCKLIHEIGGWWADADLVCLKPLPRQEYAFAYIHDIKIRPELLDLPIPRIGGNLACGLFRAPAQSRFLSDCLATIEKEALNGECPSVFGGWGPIAFTRSVCKHGLYDRRVTSLIGNGFSNWQEVFENPRWSPNPQAFTVHLWNYVKNDREYVQGSFFHRVLQRFGG